MTDLFGEWVTDEEIDRVFAVMALSPQHVFQVLTKRPERMREYLTEPAMPGRVEAWATDLSGMVIAPGWPRNWPLKNVWLGVSVEDQQRAEERIPELLACPAAVRFISAEPLMGPVVLTGMDCWRGAAGLDGESWEQEPVRPGHMNGLDWAIIGGESGPGARPMDVAWARSLVAQCQAAGVAVFVKQLGANPVTACESHGVTCGGHKWPWNENEAQARGREPRPKLRSRKGGDPEEWPADLRVREFPGVRI